MRLARYQSAPGDIQYGWILQDSIGLVEGSIFDEYQRGEADQLLEAVELLAPVQPSKIICIGRNYLAHAREHEVEIPEVPMLFLKPPSAVIGPGASILLPPQSQQVEHEIELAVVIGKRGRWIPLEEAPDHILGYTIAVDITARDLQYRDGQWTRGKGFDTFCPVGPWIETDFDPAEALMTCRVNDQVRQMATTRDMVFSVRQLIAFASSIMTLEPGDIFLTGTPAGVGILQPGDMLEASIEGIGTLRNPIAAEPPH